MSQHHLDCHKGPELLNTSANKVHSIFSSNFWSPNNESDVYTEEPAWRTLRGLAVRTMSSAVDLKNTRPVSLLITRAGVHGTRQPRFGARVQLTSRTFPLTNKRAWWSLARGRLRLSISTLTRTTLPFIPPSMLKAPSGIFWGHLRNGTSKNTLVAITRFQMSP